MDSTPQSNLRSAWNHFKALEFPSVEKAENTHLDALIEILLDFDTRVAGSIETLLSGSAVPANAFVVPDRIYAELRATEQAAAEDSVADAIAAYTRNLIEIVEEAYSYAAGRTSSSGLGLGEIEADDPEP